MLAGKKAHVYFIRDHVSAPGRHTSCVAEESKSREGLKMRHWKVLTHELRFEAVRQEKCGEGKSIQDQGIKQEKSKYGPTLGHNR